MNRRLIAVSLNTVISLAALYAAWLYTESIARQKFESDITKVKQAFYEGVKSLDSAVDGVHSFTQVTSDPNQEVFGRFTTEALSKNAAVTNVSLYKYVTSVQRDAFETQLKSSGQGTEILEGGIEPGSKVQASPSKDFYFPLYAVDSKSKEAAYFGWDLRSDPSKSKPMTHAVETGLDQASESYLLENGNVAIDIFSPVLLVLTDPKTINAMIVTTVDLTKLFGEEKWREGVELKLGLKLAGDTNDKDIYRHIDAQAEGKLVLDRLYSEIQVDKFGQILTLKFNKAITPDRINPGALLLTLLGSIILAVLAMKLLRTYEKLQESLSQLADANANLEKKVADRTKELASAHKEIKEVMDNLDEVVVTFDGNRKIGPVFSPATKRILGVEEIAGKHVEELLFAELNRHDENSSRHLFALEMLKTFDDFQWSMSKTDLLSEVKVTNPKDQSVKTMSLRYSPVFVDDKYEKMVLVASDITEMLQLRESLAASEKENSLRASIINEIAASDKSQVGTFFQESGSRISIVTKFVDSDTTDGTNPKKSDRPEIAILLRELHTLKGAARSAGLKALAKSIHEAEDLLEPLRQEVASSQGNIKDVTLDAIQVSGLKKSIETYETYTKTYGEIFASANSDNGLNQRSLQALKSIVYNESISGKDRIRGFEIITSSDHFEVGELFQGFAQSLQEISQQLDKTLSVESPLWLLYCDRGVRSALHEAFTHATRNAVDHGIESPNERTAAGKSPEGRMWLETERSAENLTLKLCDDGRGVDPNRIYSIGKSKGLVSVPQDKMTTDDIIDLLFLPGFSTKEQISDLSGRGVGLDAVRNSCQKLGIKCKITSTKGAGSQFTIQIPAKYIGVEFKNAEARVMVEPPTKRVA